MVGHCGSLLTARHVQPHWRQVRTITRANAPLLLSLQLSGRPGPRVAEGRKSRLATCRQALYSGGRFPDPSVFQSRLCTRGGRSPSAAPRTRSTSGWCSLCLIQPAASLRTLVKHPAAWRGPRLPWTTAPCSMPGCAANQRGSRLSAASLARPAGMRRAEWPHCPR